MVPLFMWVILLFFILVYVHAILLLLCTVKNIKIYPVTLVISILNGNGILCNCPSEGLNSPSSFLFAAAHDGPVPLRRPL